MPSNFFTTTVNDSDEGNSCPAVNPESECFSLCSMTHQPSNRHVRGRIVLLGTRDLGVLLQNWHVVKCVSW